jgi:LPS sulfotransferase NodH
MWWQFERLVSETSFYAQRDVSAIGALNRLLDDDFVVIRLYREDILRQAISWVRAIQTGAWSSAVVASDATTVQPSYDFAWFMRAARSIQGQNCLWDSWIQESGLRFLRVSYEELVANSSQIMARILLVLGQAPERAVNLRPRLRRQSDIISERFLLRARLDLKSHAEELSC